MCERMCDARVPQLALLESLYAYAVCAEFATSSLIADAVTARGGALIAVTLDVGMYVGVEHVVRGATAMACCTPG